MPHNMNTEMTREYTLGHSNIVHIGGRKSRLAVVQSEHVKAAIEKALPEMQCDILALSTLGDKIQNKPLYSFGGKALWTKELEILLQPHDFPEYPQLDLIVHSLKDMPTNLPEEFELGCITEREDPRDALVMAKGSPYRTLADLPVGATVGTSSVRRSAQLIKNYPHLKFESVRGNLNTRLAKLDDPESVFSCLILAAAGLIRIGLGGRITSLLDCPEMYYAVGQGALGVEIKRGDTRIKQIMRQIEHLPTTYCCLAERALMRYLEGGCSVPIGVKSDYNEQTKMLSLKGIIVSPDGQQWIEDVVEGVIITEKSDAEKVGIQLGDLLIAKGAKEILQAIDFERINRPPISAIPTPTPSRAEFRPFELHQLQTVEQ